MKTLSSLFFALAILTIMWGGFDFYFHTHIIAGVLNALVTLVQAILS